MALSNRLRICRACRQERPLSALDVRDFPFWDGVSPRMITISNIDGIIHDREGAQPWGRFLIAEAKRIDEEMKPGQRELLGALSRIPDVGSVVIREGMRGTYGIDIASRGQWAQLSQVATADELRRFLAKWWDAPMSGA